MKMKNYLMLSVGLVLAMPFVSCDKKVEPGDDGGSAVLGRIKEVQYYVGPSVIYEGKDVFYYNEDGTLHYYTSESGASTGDERSQLDSTVFKYDSEKRVITETRHHYNDFDLLYEYRGDRYTYNGLETRVISRVSFNQDYDTGPYNAYYRYTDSGNTVHAQWHGGDGFSDGDYTDYVVENGNVVKSSHFIGGNLVLEYVAEFDTNKNPFEGIMYSPSFDYEPAGTLPGDIWSPNNCTSFGNVLEPFSYTNTYEFDGEFLVKSTHSSDETFMTMEYVYE